MSAQAHVARFRSQQLDQNLPSRRESKALPLLPEEDPEDSLSPVKTSFGKESIIDSH